MEQLLAMILAVILFYINIQTWFCGFKVACVFDGRLTIISF